MNTIFILAIASILILVAIYYEPKIAKWERRILKRIGKFIIRVYDKHQAKKANKI